MRTEMGFTASNGGGAAAVPTSSALPHTQQPQHSPWHSPVPYLFGGLAAMLGLIAFALLILACSYWKLSGYLEEGAEDGAGDLEAGGERKDGGAVKAPPVFEKKFVVIMAGDEKPTFLATPVSSRSSSFGDNGKGHGVDPIPEGKEHAEAEEETCGGCSEASAPEQSREKSSDGLSHQDRGHAES